ncbi:MAG: hypothetical protein WD065_04435 [Planctomycetaceae bacterium]
MKTYLVSFPRGRSHRRKGGALYITVLSMTLIISLLGLAGLGVVRIERKQSLSSTDMLAARANSRSGVELALSAIGSNSNWRTTYANGVETTKQTLGSNGAGTVSWILQDSDGSLTNADTNLRLKGVGRVNETVQVSEVQLLKNGPSCLEAAMHAHNSIYIDGKKLFNNQTISSNNYVTEAGSSNVYGNVEAVNTINGSDYRGTTSTGISARTMPDSSAFDYYLANGTSISVLSLPGFLLTKEFKRKVLSPTSNPYGSTNPQGIYVINCLGLYTVEIKECRIVGTVVLLNCLGTPLIGKDMIHWEPAVPNYPSLLVSGSLSLKMEYRSDGLDEGQWGNFNPLGTPFPYVGGVSDNDAADKWPSEFKGLIYATGDIVFENKPARITGVVVSGQNITIRNDTDQIVYNSIFLENPPPGFVGTGMRVNPRTWKRAAAP